MSRPAPKHTHTGPFTASQLSESDRYELTEGHPVYRGPGGGDHARTSTLAAEVVDSDPDAEETGVDAGYSWEPSALRAPDVAVGNVPDRPGWIPGAPKLAIEVATANQDESDLQQKLAELFRAGTRLVWVVRLVGSRRVEVYEAEKLVRVVGPGEKLLAPGILRNPVPVEALYDRRVAHDVTFHNLLNRLGYQDLEQVKAEGVKEGLQEGTLVSVVSLFAARLGRPVSDDEERILAARIPALGLDAVQRAALEMDAAGLAAWLRS
ncbi:MAG: Uma2 family endonuclease [Myxococcota bacterium]